MDLNSNILIVFITVGSLGLGFVLALVLIAVRSWLRAGAERILGLCKPSKLEEILPDAVIRLDSRGIVRSLNKAAEELFGYERYQAQGQPVSNMIRGATTFGHGPRNRNNSAQAPFQASAGIETEGIRKDGSSFPALCIPLKTSILRGAHVMVRDETGRTKLRELQARSELLTAAIQGIRTPVLAVNRASRVSFLNRTCERLFGSSISQGSSLQELLRKSSYTGPDGEQPGRIHFEHAESGYIFTVLAEGNTLGQEYVLMSGARKDGGGGEERYGAHVRRFEDLLTRISGYSELLLTSIESTHPIREDLEQVHEASQEAVSILHGLRRDRR